MTVTTRASLRMSEGLVERKESARSEKSTEEDSFVRNSGQINTNNTQVEVNKNIGVKLESLKEKSNSQKKNLLESHL